MSTENSLMADEDESFVRRVMYIMAVWTVLVVIAGLILVVLRDPLASFFAFSGIGL